MSFATQILHWFATHGRKNLPWQHNPSPYRVWVSEIMLQQTQVSTVIPYYQRFMERFPDAISLANASSDEVLKYWQGLGYYSRARYLHHAAQQIRDQYHGEFPTSLEAAISLSGIGRSTAGAILSLSLNQAHAILDGNVKRVLARYHAVTGDPSTPAVQKQLWHYAEQHLPHEQNAAYTQAMMDMGATLCTRSKPLCLLCPLQTACLGYLSGNPLQYPSPKVRKALPEKQAFALLLRNPNGEWLIQKRPPTGIWGGLWSFPEFADVQQAQNWLTTLLPNPQVLAKTWASLQRETASIHTFSHYRLTLIPLVVEMPDSMMRVMEGNSWLWYNGAREFSGGLSSAVQQLLADKELL